MVVAVSWLEPETMTTNKPTGSGMAPHGSFEMFDFFAELEPRYGIEP